MSQKSKLMAEKLHLIMTFQAVQEGVDQEPEEEDDFAKFMKADLTKSLPKIMGKIFCLIF